MVEDGARTGRVVTIDVVDAVARVEPVVRRHRRPDVGDTRRPPAVRFVVEDFELVKVRVTEELAGDRRFVPESTVNIHLEIIIDGKPPEGAYYANVTWTTLWTIGGGSQ